MNFSPNTLGSFESCAEVVRSLGCALVDLQWSVSAVSRRVQQAQGRARAVIYSAGGVTLDVYARVHRILVPRLQALGGVRTVFLEVGSPGERVIRNAAEFSIFLGETVKVWFCTGQFQVGTLAFADETCLTLTSGGVPVTIPYVQLTKAQLHPAVRA